MDCDKYLELMSAALDGELTGEERCELDSHLAVCPECAQLFRTLSANARAMRELDCEVPAGLKQRIMDNLPAQEKPLSSTKPVRRASKTGRVIHWKRWIPVAAAACLVLVVSLIPGGFSNSASMNMSTAAPRSPETPAAPGAEAMPSSIVGRYECDSNSTAYGTIPSGNLDMGGLTDPAEPTAQEPQPDAGLEVENTPAAEAPPPAEPAEPSHYFFENPLSIRVSYGATPDPGARIIGSVESLEHYLAQFGSMSFDGEGNPIPNAKLETLREVYNEAFFRTRRLLCVVVESGSGSNRYEIADVLRDSVLVSMYSPEIGTCDMAAWLLVAEVDTMFEDGDVLEASISNSVRQTIAPIGTVVQETTISLAFEKQRSIHIRYHNCPEEGAVIIGSVESLNEYLSQFKSYLGQELADVSENLQMLQNHYGYDQFFENERLLMIRIDAPSGGDRYRIADGGLSRKSVILEQTADGATFDVKSWLIVAEVSANFFEDGDTLKVSIDKAYDRYCYIDNVWFQRVGLGGRTSSETTVIRNMDELNAYLENNIYYTDPVSGELIRDPAPEDLISIYGAPVSETSFRDGFALLAFKMSSPVYNTRYEVLTVSSEAVTIRQDHYFYGDTCPSTWLILVQAYGNVDPDNPPKLVVEDGYP